MEIPLGPMFKHIVAFTYHDISWSYYESLRKTWDMAIMQGLHIMLSLLQYQAVTEEEN